MIYRVKASNPMLYNLLQPARKKRFETVFPEQQGIFSETTWRFLRITTVIYGCRRHAVKQNQPYFLHKSGPK